MEPINTLLEKLLDTMYQQGASDLHLATGRVPFARIQSELVPLQAFQPLSSQEIVGLLKLFVDAKKIEKITDLHEVDFGYQYKDLMRLRGNVFIKSGKIALALRSIQEVKNLDYLKLPQVLKKFTQSKQGFFLVTGPVGQGKSTTLAAMIDEINSNRKEHIVTIEHPIEYVHTEKKSIIDQREVAIDTQSFHQALEAVFRQDVNVIMIGEMRTPETIATAVTAAETGHLVFSTLHTNNASQTIDRIIDSFPPNQQDQIRTQLASTLLGVFSQRLIPSLKGGLVPAYELLINTKAVANLIREKRTHEIETLLETGTEQGMITMNRSLIELVRSGDITMDEARLHSLNPQGLEGML